MTKNEIIAILKERGIEHDPLVKKAELEALLPEDVAKDANTSNSEATEDDGVQSVDVYNKFGVYVRTYSKEIHGDNFKQLAEQFQNKII